MQREIVKREQNGTKSKSPKLDEAQATGWGLEPNHSRL